MTSLKTQKAPRFLKISSLNKYYDIVEAIKKSNKSEKVLKSKKTIRDLIAFEPLFVYKTRFTKKSQEVTNRNMIDCDVFFHL